MMSKLVRSAVVRLRGVFGIHSSRRTVRIPLSVSLSDVTSTGGGSQGACEGYTCDLSSTGLSFVLPTTSVGNRHIFSEGGALLRIRLELPTGAVDINVTPVRYDLFDGRGKERGYLVGAHIMGMGDGDRARYVEFIRAPTRYLNVVARIKTPGAASAVSHTG